MTYDSALYPRREPVKAQRATAAPELGHAAALWFAAALGIMVAGQIGRLFTGGNATAWLALDYGWRLAALGVLAAGPLRTIAFTGERRLIRVWETVLWIVALVIVDRVFGGWLRDMLPAVGGFSASPRVWGWLRVLDLFVGLALVAASEEILFRRCARTLIQRYITDNASMVVIASATLFALAHWWTGIPNIAAAALFGAIAMLAYMRIGALWPMIVAHYFCDLISFG